MVIRLIALRVNFPFILLWNKYLIIYAKLLRLKNTSGCISKKIANLTVHKLLLITHRSHISTPPQQVHMIEMLLFVYDVTHDIASISLSSYKVMHYGPRNVGNLWCLCWFTHVMFATHMVHGYLRTDRLMVKFSLGMRLHLHEKAMQLMMVLGNS